MMTGDGWQVCKSDRCRAGENKGPPCPRGGDRAEHLLRTATAVKPPLLSVCSGLGLSVRAQQTVCQGFYNSPSSPFIDVPLTHKHKNSKINTNTHKISLVHYIYGSMFQSVLIDVQLCN